MDTFRPCLVIPNFNHGYALPALINQLEQLQLTVFVVNDASTDTTAEVIDDLASKYPWIFAIHRPQNGGKGAAISEGIVHAHHRGFSHAICIDGDGQHATSDIPKFLDEARHNQSALVLGFPKFGADAPLERRLGREISNLLVVLATWGFLARDVLFGFRVYPITRFLEVSDSVRRRSRMGFDAEILIRLLWSGIKVKNIGTPVEYPKGGVSHFNYTRDNLALAKIYIKSLLLGLYLGPRRIVRGLIRREDRSSKPWYQTSERGSSVGLRILLRVLELVGRRALLVVVAPVILYLFLRGGAARRSALAYQRRLSKFQQTGKSTIGLYWGAFLQFWEFGISIIDKVTSWRGGLPIERCRWQGNDEVKNHLARGQGVILFSAHVGNLEVIRALGDSSNIVVNALMYTENSKKFRSFLEHINRDSFLRVRDLSTFDPTLIFELQECLNRGEVIALLVDRETKNAADRSVEVSLLGGKVEFPEGPWILASLFDAPVFSVFSMRGQGGMYDVTIAPLAAKVVLPRSERREKIRVYASQFAQELESILKKYPNQWFNFFDYWNDEKQSEQ